MPSCSDNDTKQENEDDSFPDSGDEHKLGLNINHSETANTEVLSLTEDFEEHRTHPEELNEPGSVTENGITTNCKANIEGLGFSCKVSK